MSILGFCLDHAILLVNAHAIQDILSFDQFDAPLNLAKLSQQSVEVAVRMLDTILFDPSFQPLKIGIINTQLLMICHAAIEIIQVGENTTEAGED